MSNVDPTILAAELRQVVEPGLGAVEAGAEIQAGALQVLTNLVGQVMQQSAAQHAESQAALQGLTGQMVAQQILLLRLAPAS